ncbi:hypothetical protein CsSME_00028351 [Camellia sinensis var. sinensis]
MAWVPVCVIEHFGVIRLHFLSNSLLGFVLRLGGSLTCAPMIIVKTFFILVWLILPSSFFQPASALFTSMLRKL